MDWVFTEDTPLVVRFVLAIIVVLLIAWAVSWVLRLAIPNKRRPTPKTSISGNWTIRRAVIATAELMAMMQLFAMTIGGAIVGASLGRMMGFGTGPGRVAQLESTFMMLGGGIGFLMAVVWLGFVYVLAEIERNTRHTAAMLEHIVMRGQENTREDAG